MLLYLVRHGIAVEPTDPEAPATDAERPLTPQGRQRAEAAFRGLLALEAAPSMILSSPLCRAAETAAIAAQVFRREGIRRTSALEPGAEPGALFQILRKLTVDEVLAVGHRPHIDSFLAAAVGTHRSEVTAFGKVGVAVLDFRTKKPGQADLLAFYPPRALRLIAKQAK